jgi:hypothetical protein
MKIVGCDLHTRYQQIAMLDDETGELVERRLEHANGEAKEFYTNLAGCPSPKFHLAVRRVRFVNLKEGSRWILGSDKWAW